MKNWKAYALGLVAVFGLMGLAMVADSGGSGRYKVQTLKWSKYNSVGVLTDSTQVYVEYAAPLAAGGEDTTQWVDTWAFKRPTSLAALDTLHAALPGAFKFTYGGSTADTMQATIQYTEDTGAGTITTLDLIQIRKLILNVITAFPNNTSWRFVEADYDFPESTNPWFEEFPELINENNLAGLYGPKDPAVYGPYGLRADGSAGLLPVVTQDDVACRPCTLRRCADPLCMNTMAPDRVYEAVTALLPAETHVRS